MKKNLKKVISTVIALALSLSTFATLSFAEETVAGYDDVKASDSYAEAVTVLSALEIVEGKGEGKFDPDATVKRSEAAKMITGMVNAMGAAEKKAGRTSFNDVAADHWASGYIQYGVDNGWIKGKGNNNFAPDAEVKIEELVKMIVVNLGWTEDYLLSFGAYPTVFTNKAEDYFLDASKYDYKAAATRGEVAEIIFEAMKAPIAKEGSDSEWSDNKNGWVTKPVAQEGDNNSTNNVYYKSLLSEKFDAYAVEGMVTATPKQGGTKAGEITFTVSKSEDYVETAVLKNAVATNVKFGDTNAANLINTYASAIIKVDEDGKKEMVAIFASAKNNSVALDASLFDGIVNNAGAAQTTFGDDYDLKYFASEDAARADKYEVKAGTKLYVNGVEVTADAANIATFITNNTVGTVELVDVYAAGTGTDGVYDYIYVDYYVTAEVSGISGQKLAVKGIEGLVGGSFGSIDLDTEKNDELEYAIYVNGAKASLADVKKGDIVSIAYDVVNGAAASNFFEIIVSRDTVSGVVTSKNSADEYIVVAGEEYSLVDWAGENGSITSGNEYELLLDAFGRVYDVDMIASNAKYAMLIAAGTDGVEGLQAKIMLADGTVTTYPVKLTQAATNANVNLSDDVANTDWDESADLNSTDLTVVASVMAPEYRVFKYTMKNGAIATIDFVAADNVGASLGEFKSRTGAVSGTRIDDATVIIDASKAWAKYADNGALADTAADWNLLAMGDYASFVDGDKYTVFGWEDAGVAEFAILVEGKSVYGENTALATVSAAVSTGVNDDNVSGYFVTVTEGQEVKTLFTELNVAALNIGDVIVYTVDTKGEIDEYASLYAPSSADNDTYKAAIHAALNVANATYASIITIPGTTDFAEWKTGWDATTDDIISLVFAPIVEADGDTMTLAQITGNKTYFSTDVATGDAAQASNGGIMVYGLDDETRVTVYDFSEAKTNKRVKTGTIGDIFASPLILSNNDEEIDWADATNVAAAKNYAFAKVVDGVATDVVVFQVQD